MQKKCRNRQMPAASLNVGVVTLEIQGRSKNLLAGAS
jgi:hypothetical protein